ncbi:hypothetical protein ZIOFF_057118 [Zingiber officinale]|uniref:MADS-box domain-containing protein n=2 Tax=Zingiber officinale TaxID=94328 RepID=A0A8J5FC12_ZINOF|nr:hypothetical protein ZIOFF_057118 [Zingiber officinale]
MQGKMVKNGGTSKGRRKIEIKKIESEDARHVCFSKRKAGIFAKASDLSTLCGAEVAIVIYSPVGNPYSFGSPSVEPLVDRFLSGSFRHQPISGKSNTVVQLNQQYMELSRQSDIAKATKVNLEERHRELLQSPELDCANDIKQLGLDQLDQLKNRLEHLKMRLDDRIKDYLHVASTQRMASPMMTTTRTLGLFSPDGATGPSSSSSACPPPWPISFEMNHGEPISFQALLATTTGTNLARYVHKP